MALFCDNLEVYNDVKRGIVGRTYGALLSPPLLSLCWSRDRTNHVLVIRLETAADQDVFLSPSSSPFPVRFSALLFLIAVCVFGALTTGNPNAVFSYIITV